MRAHRGRRAPSVLLAGDSADLRDLHALAATLPADAYGQVYIEVASALQVEPIALPVRVGVTWLVREQAAGVAARGALLTAAVTAWMDEWMPEGVREDRRIAWVGCSAAPQLADRYRSLQEASMTAAAMGLPTVGIDDAE